MINITAPQPLVNTPLQTSFNVPAYMGPPIPMTGYYSEGRIDTMAHHNRNPYLNTKEALVYRSKGDHPYGVPSISTERRILSLRLMARRHMQIRQALLSAGLPTAERECVFHLLRLHAAYGAVFPSARWIGEQPGCSARTFWRAVSRLKELKLVQVVNRFVMQERAQLSNLYRLDRLLLLIARVLAEKGHAIEGWLKPVLMVPDFWRRFWAGDHPFALSWVWQEEAR